MRRSEQWRFLIWLSTISTLQTMGMVWAKEMPVVRKNCIMNSGKGYRRPSEKGYAGKQIHSVEETSDRIDRSNDLKTVLSGKAPEALKAAMSALSKAQISFSGF